MGEVLSIDGPLVRLHLPGVRSGEQVRVGELGLVGEVIGLDGERALAQLYEESGGLRPGEPAEALGRPLSVELGPGLLGQIYDGVQRPLGGLYRESGDFIGRGLHLPALDREKRWPFEPEPGLEPGVHLEAGARLGRVPETGSVEHRILVPPDAAGELVDLASSGEYGVDEVVAHLRDRNGKIRKLRLFHRWPVRTPRPYRARNHAVAPLITGQRVLDTFFPLLKGGKGAIPGPFGAGKTMLQHQISRWTNADIVLFVGCGERGNELVDLLESFPRLTDPRTGRSLMERTLLVANTSNMPVVAREASIYVGVTIAEYYRDQGYDVLLVADSTSRWAEALREVAGRLGQMPVEEGHPAYLASRLGAFYERAGRVDTLGGAEGSVTIVGAVSPPGGDFSEPVTSHTKEVVQTFWALAKELADARHYPAVDWKESFSDSVPVAARWWHQEVDSRWSGHRKAGLALLGEADELAQIVNLVGPEALSAEQRWVLESAALIREGVLQQSAMDEVDAYCSPEKQFLLLDLLLQIHEEGARLLAAGVPVQRLLELRLLPQARRLKSQFPDRELEGLKAFSSAIHAAFDGLRAECLPGDARSEEGRS
ncbi:MAG: ATP synthase subunit A [Gammaproteobacteria bacterium]